ncbi:MAG: hypothetical protein AAF368_09130 [Planctomycetota bacterium]
MKTPPNRPTGNASSLSGRPQAFSHVKGLRPGFQQAATGEREKKQTRAKAPNVKKEFKKAHEGPREKLAEPKRRHVPTPGGGVVKEVHTQVEREKQARNREKDLQMKKWRERKVPQPSRPLPQHDLKKTTPEVRMSSSKTRSVKEAIQAKKARRRRGR